MRHLALDGLLFAKVSNGEYFRLRCSFERAFGRPGHAAEVFSPSRRVAHYSVWSLRQLVARVEAGLEVLEIGAALPIDSPRWKQATGLDLEIEPSWRRPGLAGRLLRCALHAVARAEMALALTQKTLLAPSI